MTLNKYYPDTAPGSGYNDLELMRYKRTYTQGPNTKGSQELPMKQTRAWLKTTVEGN